MPDIAAHERDDMRFPEQRDVLAEAFGFKPSLGDWQKRHEAHMG